IRSLFTSPRALKYCSSSLIEAFRLQLCRTSELSLSSPANNWHIRISGYRMVPCRRFRMTRVAPQCSVREPSLPELLRSGRVATEAKEQRYAGALQRSVSLYRQLSAFDYG